MSIPTTIIDGYGTGHKLKVNGEGEIGVVIHTHPPIDETLESYPFTDYFRNAGSNDMRVNGSTTPVEFTINADPNRDYYIKVISVYIADAGASLNEFGNLSALTNGVSFTYKNDNIGLVTIQDEIQTNLDFIRLGHDTVGIGDGTSAYKLDISGGGGADAYLPVLDLAKTFGFPWGLRLQKGSTDKLSFFVNDNLSTGMDAFNIKGFGVQI